MDRDRIVEDVSDMDDYFDYERPLDFVSRAERRKVMKEAKGDEDLANQLLIERANAEAGITTPPATESETNGDIVDAEIEAPSGDEDEQNPVEAESVEASDEEDDSSDDSDEQNPVEVEAVEEEKPKIIEKAEPVAKAEPVKKPPAPKAEPPKKAPESSAGSDDDLSILGLD